VILVIWIPAQIKTSAETLEGKKCVFRRSIFRRILTVCTVLIEGLGINQYRMESFALK